MSSFYKKWIDSKVDHLIYTKPGPTKLVDSHLIEKPNVLRFYNGENYAMYIIAGFFASVIIIIIIITGGNPFNKESHAFFIMASSAIALTCLYGYTLPKKYYEYKRLEGEITIPPKFYGKHSTFQFKDAKLFWNGEGGASGALRVALYIAAPDKQLGVSIVAASKNLNDSEDLSFIVWYMDKNRPLPLDPIFDPYRNADFERRKAEGFPPPLYLSQIPTPEATPEQQKEREKYWKDKDHMGRSTSAWL
ncbi:MAG: hypothetical protein ACK5IQ_04415 [Bacteroidales bacterium]